MTPVALLTIGTEITSGQIINTNGSWLANKLIDSGFAVALHLSVEDEPEAMASAFDYCSQHASIIITTGGLGPTADDITRQAIADFLELPLEFRQEAWEELRAKMLAFSGQEPSPSNRQQCYFPVEAQRLPNPLGSAEGFLSWDRAAKTAVAALPGPPRELQPLFVQELLPLLLERFPQQAAKKLHRWHVMGVKEAELGEQVESLIAGSPLTSGYRPHFPYVEVKIWEPRGIEGTRKSLVILDEALAAHCVNRDDDDVADQVIQGLSHYEQLEIVDEVSGGYLAERLRDSKLRLRQQSFVSTSCLGPSLNRPKPANTPYLSLKSEDEDSWRIELFLSALRPSLVAVENFGRYSRMGEKRRWAYAGERTLVLVRDYLRRSAV